MKRLKIYFSIQLRGMSKFNYETGDYLLVLPKNNAEYVDKIVENFNSTNKTALKEAFLYYFDIMYPPNSELMQCLINTIEFQNQNDKQNLQLRVNVCSSGKKFFLRYSHF
jgi:sulfite reductase alpha subunit-like flavoprotein